MGLVAQNHAQEVERSDVNPPGLLAKQKMNDDRARPLRGRLPESQDG